MAASQTMWKLFATVSTATLLVVLYWHKSPHVVRMDTQQQQIISAVPTVPQIWVVNNAAPRVKSPNGELNFLRENGISINLAGAVVDNLTTDQLLLTAHSVLDNTDTVCSRKLRMGNMADGGWEICDDVDVAPGYPCTIYSFGINNDFSFDDDASKLYGCHVYSFDPSMAKSDHNRSNLVHFYKLGIFGETTVNKRKWSLFTVNDLKKKLGHEKTKIDVIKMDVEGSEWSSLPQMITSGALDDVNQLLVEFHVAASNLRAYILPKVKLLQDLELKGFKKFYVSKNFHCKTQVRKFPIERTKCYEIHYVRRPTI